MEKFKKVFKLRVTPGRLFDLMERGYLKTNNVSMFIIDEADQMLFKILKNKFVKL